MIGFPKNTYPEDEELFICFIVIIGLFSGICNDDALLDSLRLNLETAEGKTGNALAEAYRIWGIITCISSPIRLIIIFRKA